MAEINCIAYAVKRTFGLKRRKMKTRILIILLLFLSVSVFSQTGEDRKEDALEYAIKNKFQIQIQTNLGHYILGEPSYSNVSQELSGRLEDYVPGVESGQKIILLKVARLKVDEQNNTEIKLLKIEVDYSSNEELQKFSDANSNSGYGDVANEETDQPEQSESTEPDDGECDQIILVSGEERSCIIMEVNEQFVRYTLCPSDGRQFELEQKGVKEIIRQGNVVDPQPKEEPKTTTVNRTNQFMVEMTDKNRQKDLFIYKNGRIEQATICGFDPRNKSYTYRLKPDGMKYNVQARELDTLVWDNRVSIDDGYFELDETKMKEIKALHLLGQAKKDKIQSIFLFAGAGHATLFAISNGAVGNATPGTVLFFGVFTGAALGLTTIGILKLIRASKSRDTVRTAIIY